MKSLDYPTFEEFVRKEVDIFLDARFKPLEEMRLRDILSKNPYLFRAKNPLSVEDLIEAMIEARLSSSEEKKFGDLLERIAIFVSKLTCDGRKSSATGIDLEFENEGILYLVAIKSGPNWGNSSQYQSLEANFRQALRVQRQANSGLHLQPVLGICYGKLPMSDTGLYIRLTGRQFWEFISGESHLHLHLMELIGERTTLYQKDFLLKRAELKQKLITEFTTHYCFQDGSIDWQKVADYNSGN